MGNFDTRHRRGESRDKGKAPATEPGRHSISGRPGALHIDNVSYVEFTSLLRFFTVQCTYIMESQDMDDFDIPARRGQSCDKGKGKGKAATTETG